MALMENLLCSLPLELLSLLLRHLSLRDLNSLRLVCRRLQDVVELPAPLSTSLRHGWGRAPCVMAMRRQRARKLAEAFLPAPHLEVTAIMEVWGRRLEEGLFLGARSQGDYSQGFSRKLFQLHRLRVDRARAREGRGGSCWSRP